MYISSNFSSFMGDQSLALGAILLILSVPAALAAYKYARVRHYPLALFLVAVLSALGAFAVGAISQAIQYYATTSSHPTLILYCIAAGVTAMAVTVHVVNRSRAKPAKSPIGTSF